MPSLLNLNESTSNESNNNKTDNSSSKPDTPPTTVAPPGPNIGGFAQKPGTAGSNSNNNKAGTFNTQAATAYFFVLTTFYVVLSYIMSGNPDPVKDAKNQAIYFGSYMLLLILGEYYQNLTLTTQYCYSAQVKTAGMMTFVPWVSIFGVLMIMIKIFEGWLAPFANTFGYGFAKLAGLNSLMQDKILKPPQDLDDEDLKHSLAEILTDPSILFNQIPRDTLTFDSFWAKIKPLLRTSVLPEDKLKLRHLVTLKYSVAWYVWYLLGGLLTIAVSVNWLMSTGCDQNAKEMIQRHSDYEKCLAGDKSYCPSEETDQLLDKKPTKLYASYNQS